MTQLSTVETAEIARRKQKLIDRYGDWTAHNIQLTPDLYTLTKPAGASSDPKSSRYLQIAADLAGKPLDQLRVLDLACLEGQYAIEFALHGAEAVGIEGREANIQKAVFAKEVLGLDRLTLAQDDVRNLSIERYGLFDVVLCLGILYHIDVPDVFDFLQRISDTCQGVAIFDTHIALNRNVCHEHNGHQYWGSTFPEHDPATSLEERKKSLWASLDNITSFWPTRASLYNMLTDVGFTSVYECYIPNDSDKPNDRVTLVAVRGTPQQVLAFPPANLAPLPPCAEWLPEETFGRRAARRIKRIAKRLLKGR